MSLRLGVPCHHFEEVDSTSAELKRLALAGAPVGTVVIARAQTAGYGQRGRAWVSGADQGLYVSLLMPSPNVPTQLPFVLGLGCYDALFQLTQEAGLKWVNDLVACRRKLGGILVELSKDYAIAGIGVNLQAQAVPDAIALADLMPVVPSSAALLALLLRAIETRHAQWLLGGFKPVLSAWQQASVTLGETIQVLGGAKPLIGVAEGLGPQGELLVRRADDTLEVVVSGSVRLADGSYC